ncbi:UDP-2,3-diacylglucosamine diphosphatase [Hydrocarboniphaga effusa]|uniref:UDP-2,3-diacylglucosamine diphosphatase n=1 Tax=Hydrocarboniphaga effusa TaxID=243629 RepID=UPI003137AC11
MTTLLLSDLHLPASASTLRQDFLRFLQGPARKARAVYLLGDVFEAWIGDEDGLAHYGDEIAALRALSEAGVRVFFQHGNRDFLVGERFAQASGASLLADPSVVDIEGRRTLLTHGDLLCTDDIGYQRWRRFSRNGVVQWLFMRIPGGLKRAIADRLRRGSKSAKTRKSTAIMDVNDTAVSACFLRHGVDRIIHGHTHRPDVHHELIDGRTCERIVLADWREHSREYLEVTREGWKRVDIAAS